MSAERRHVPKFGSWDSDNVPYTAYFENARKEKTSKIINPNDPEENPEAFGGTGSGTNKSGTGGVVKQRNIHHRRNNNNNAGSENQRQMKKYEQQGSMESGNFVLSSPGTERNRNAGNPYDDHSYISAASVPKFGAWDEMDPNSGDGFTVIFNRVKEEKQIAASRAVLPPPPTSTITPPHPAAVNGRHTTITSKANTFLLLIPQSQRFLDSHGQEKSYSDFQCF